MGFNLAFKWLKTKMTDIIVKSNVEVVVFVESNYMQVMVILTPCRPDGVLIKYPQFLDILNALNVQPHNIFLLTV